MKNLVLAALAITGVVIAGILISRRLRSPELPNGNMTTPTPISSQEGSVSGATIEGRPRVTIATSKGDIVVDLRPDLAPKTVENFLNKFSNGYCAGKTFHRVENWVIQGCDPLGNGTGGNTTLPTEISSGSFTAGALGVARKMTPKEFSNDSQFFITKTDSTFLDGEYTYFGHVVSGMDVVNQIAVGDTISSTTILSK